MLIVAARSRSAARARLEQRNLYREKATATRHAVEVAYGVLDYYGKRAQAGELSEDAAKAAAAASIRGTRYERTEYFWINDFHPRVVMHPVNATLVGRDVSTFADPNGKLIYMEAVALARSGGGGHMEYMWPKPGETEPTEAVVRQALPAMELGHRSGIHVEDVREQVAIDRRLPRGRRARDAAGDVDGA